MRTGYNYDDRQPFVSRSSGKERDTETGLDYFGARYYGNNMGRWMSPDWSANPSPVPYAKLDNPQSLNLYSYVLNNPASNRDADGHICIFGIGHCNNDSPPPVKTTPPPVDQKAMNQSIDQYHPGKGKQTSAQIAGIVNAETRGMKDSKNANEPLANAREKIASVRINGIEKWGDKVDKHAGMAQPNMGGPDYQPSLEATRQAVVDHLQGNDPTNGATNYNMRTSMSDQSDFQGQSLHTQSGPYQSPTKYNVINTYGPDDD